MTRKMKDSGVEWIGMMPDEWRLLKGRYCYDIQSGFPFESDKFSVEKGFPLIRIRDITSGMIETYYDGVFPEEFVVNKGDFLIGMDGDFNVRMWDNRAALLNQRCCRIFEYSGYERKYLFYILPYYLNLVNQLTYSTTVKHLSVPDLREADIPSPTLLEQRRIVRFLDAKCASIDDVIAKTTESIEEYKKLKQAVITEAVTKGIRGKRPMKDSDVDWIGQVPSDWNLQRIKTLFDLRTELNFKPLEEVNLISLYTDKGVVQHADLEKTTGNKAMNADGYKVVYENDIVVNIILCWMGAIGRSAYNGVTSPAYDVYYPKNGVESQFYHYYFRTAGFNGECFTRGRGIMLMRWRTYSDQFRDIRVVVPPLAEQKEIVKYLDSKCAAIDTLISKKQQFIDELTAYKKSLIYEFVTGKKEVPA